MSDEKPQSDFEKLMEHARTFNRFSGIAGHKFEKLATPEPPKNAEVGWDGKKINAAKDGTDAN